MSDGKPTKPGFFRLMLSTFAAAIGVQKKENLEKDFQSASPWPFIAAGVIFTVVFLFTLIVVIKIVLSK